MGNVNYFLGTLVMLSIILLIHEFGHAFFARLFGAKATNITLGYGKKICSIGILDIRLFYFVCGKFSRGELKRNSKAAKIIVALGGLIFNIFSMALVFIPALILYPKYNIDSNAVLSTIFYTFLEYSFMCVVFNLMPKKIIGMNSDGLQLYQLIRYGESSLYGD